MPPSDMTYPHSGEIDGEDARDIAEAIADAQRDAADRAEEAWEVRNLYLTSRI
jgi:hypothetical protein